MVNQNEKIQIVSLQHNIIGSEELKIIASKVVPSEFMRSSGKSEPRYSAYLGGRALIYSLFQGNNLTACVIPNRRYGYLQVVDRKGKTIPDCFVNVSHTEEWVVAVLSPQPVGIDIESGERDATRVMDRVSTSAEKKILQRKTVVEGKEIPNPILLWSVKEAFSKALGLGMKFGFQKFEVNLNTPSEIVVKTSLVGPLELQNPSAKVFRQNQFLISVVTEKEILARGVNRRILERRDVIG